MERGQRKPSKSRNVYSRQQLRDLEHCFRKDKYLTLHRREELANRLSLPQAQIKTWFQNRRTKCKKNFERGQCDACTTLFLAHPRYHSKRDGCRWTKLAEGVVPPSRAALLCIGERMGDAADPVASVAELPLPAATKSELLYLLTGEKTTPA